MIIRSVEVSGVGRFRGAMRLRGLTPGVNVLAAPNEAGKSTLFRAVRTCLFHRHDTKVREVMDLATHDAALPVVVRVAFTRGGRDYVIAKSFVRSPQASLTRDGQEIARGRQADEMLWEILGVEPGSGRTIDDGAFGLLWVGQTRSFAMERPSEAASGALNAVIAAEVGGLVGGERARAVLAQVKAQLALLETESGKPKAGGPLKAALDAAERLRAEEAEAAARLADLDQAFRDLAQARSDLSREMDPTLRGELEERLAAARAELDAARQAASALARLDAEAQGAADRAKVAEAGWRALDEAARRIAEARGELASLDERLSALDEAAAGADARVARHLAEVSDADRGLAALAERLESLSRLEAAAAASAGLAELTDRRARAGALHDRLTAIAGEIAGIRATPELVARAERAEAEVVKAEARREAAAPRLSVVLEPGAGGRVLLDGRALDRDGAWPVLEAATLAIPGVATLTVTPPSGGAEAAEALSQHRRDLASCLAKAGAASLAEARDALSRRKALVAEQAGLEAQIALLAPRGPAGQDGIAGLDARIASAAGLVQAALREAGLAAPEPPEALAARRRALKEEEAALKARRAEAAGALDRARQEAGRRATEASEWRGRRHGVEAALAQGLRVAPDETRDGELARSAADLERARERAAASAAEAASRRAAAPGADDVKAREIKVERLIQAIENQEDRRSLAQSRVAGLEGGIMAAGGDGLGERLASLGEARALAERELARRQEEAASLRLLRDAVQDSLAQGQERYFAPVRQQLQPFLNDVFPDASLDLGDGFLPAGLKRASAVERFDLLSDGTREQIAVLVRLALGGLLAARGEAVPLILDDALVFSDDERIDRMFTALSRAAHAQQVIVLTCRTRTFAPLGGAMLSVEAA